MYSKFELIYYKNDNESQKTDAMYACDYVIFKKKVQSSVRKSTYCGRRGRVRLAFTFYLKWIFNSVLSNFYSHATVFLNESLINVIY